MNLNLPRIPKPSLDTLDAWESFAVAVAVQCACAVILLLML